MNARLRATQPKARFYLNFMLQFLLPGHIGFQKNVDLVEFVKYIYVYNV